MEVMISTVSDCSVLFTVPHSCCSVLLRAALWCSVFLHAARCFPSVLVSARLLCV